MLDEDERGGDGHPHGGGGGGHRRTRVGPAARSARTVIPDDGGGTTSPWMRSPVPTFDRPLPTELIVDVCVVGAGICGLSTAYHLATAGFEVAVIDDGPIGGGETGRTSAHLASALDDRFSRLEQAHGAEGARLAAASHVAAIDDIERIVREHRIDCDFRRLDGYLFAPLHGDNQVLEDELQAARRAGLGGVEMLARAPITSFETGPALRFPRQAQFHPIRYLAGLATALVARGGRIYTGVHARAVEAGAITVANGRGERVIRAPSVVVATHAPITSRVAMPLRQAAYRSYVIATRLARGAVPPGLYWDTEDPYHYLRTMPADRGGELLIVGGEDHRAGQDDAPEARWQRLEAWTRDRFPVTVTVDRWSGQILEPADGLAFIGRTEGKGDRGGVYLATGDSGNGLTHGAIAGMLLTDLILGRDNPWAALYDPKRISPRAISDRPAAKRDDA